MILFHFIDQMFKNIISRVISKKKKYLAVVLIRFISLFLSVFATHTLTRCGCDCIYIGSDKKHTRNLENAELTTSPQQHSPIAEWRQNILAAGSVFFFFFLFALIWNASSWISFKCNISGAKHAGTFVNSHNQNACVSGRVLSPSARIFAERIFFFISQPVSVLDALLTKLIMF